MARRIRITWEKIRVHQSEDYGGIFGIDGEPGKSAEWLVYFQVRVNGVYRDGLQWRKSGVKDNTSHRVDRQLDIDANGPISLRVFGLEEDEASAGDSLPEISVPLAPEAGWNDPNGVRYEKSNSSADFDYTVHYTVRYLDSGAVITPGHGTLFTPRFSGLWESGTKRTEWSTGLTGAQVNAQASELWGENGRLAQLQPYVLGGTVRYNTIWTFGGGGQLWNLDCDETHFRKTTDENWNWARPESVIPFVVNGQVRYAVLWNAGQHGQVWNPNTDDAGFRATTGDTWSWARPHQVHAFVVNGQVRYSCLWNKGQHSQVWHPNCSDAEARKIGADNWSWGRAHQIQPFTHNGQRRYSVLWNTGQQGQLWNIDCDETTVARNAVDTAPWGRPHQLLAASS